MGWILTALIVIGLTSIVVLINALVEYDYRDEQKFLYWALGATLIIITCLVLLLVLDFSSVDCGCLA